MRRRSSILSSSRVRSRLIMMRRLGEGGSSPFAASLVVSFLRPILEALHSTDATLLLSFFERVLLRARGWFEVVEEEGRIVVWRHTCIFVLAGSGAG